MDIAFIIKDLLTKRDGLVVPGLGSFIAEFRPASIGRDRKVIHPPQKQLRFDPRIKTDADHILANELATREKTDNQKARDQINQFVQKVNDELREQGQSEIKGVGILEKKAGGVIDLRKADIPEANLGFEDIAAEPFELENTPEPARITSAVSPPPDGKKSRRKSAVWITSLTILLLLIGYAGWYTGFYDYLIYKWEQHRKAGQVSRVQKPAKETQSEKTTRPGASDSKIDEALDQMTDKKKALMYEEPVDTNTYYLVAGSFKRYDNAREFSQQIEQKGYNAQILEKDNLFRVTVQTFDRKEDALVKLYQMRDTGRLKSIWLLTVREKDQ